jgi:hypothetical protein
MFDTPQVDASETVEAPRYDSPLANDMPAGAGIVEPRSDASMNTRCFRACYRAIDDGPTWSIDVWADDPRDVVKAVRYIITYPIAVVAVVDLSTIR